MEEAREAAIWPLRMANETYMVDGWVVGSGRNKKTGERIKSCTIITCGEQCTSIRR
jgi:hypothetical protein